MAIDHRRRKKRASQTAVVFRKRSQPPAPRQRFFRALSVLAALHRTSLISEVAAMVRQAQSL